MSKTKQKPWEKGWIPKPGAKGAVHRAPPEGWTRIRRNDFDHYVRGGASVWEQDAIIGRPGEKWRLWLDHRPGLFRAPDAEMKSLAALLVWYKIETAARTDTTTQSDSYRQMFKAAQLARSYGMGRLKLMQQSLLPHLFTAGV